MKNFYILIFKEKKINEIIAFIYIQLMIKMFKLK